MRIEFLGAQGGVASGYSATSFLINDDLLLDAGSVASKLSVDKQALIKHILVTHPHLDHIKDLGFLCDNCLGLKEDGFEVYAHQTTITCLKTHIFNDLIWPNFANIPNTENPSIRYNELVPEETVKIGDYKVTPISVNHPADTLGYIVEYQKKSVVFTSDTAATSKIWEYAHKAKNLQAIVTEVSFPNKLKNIAKLSYHHTPETFGEESKKMPKVPIYLTHLKPAFQEEIITEVQKLNIDDVQIVHHDGKVLNF